MTGMLKMLHNVVPLIGVLTLIQCVAAEIYFHETFDDQTWTERWRYSKYDQPNKRFGKFRLTAGRFYADEKHSRGIQTVDNAHYYAISARFPDGKRLSNANKTLVLQYSVKFEQNIDCGGGYIKLFDCHLDQDTLHGQTPYLMMFGPDICGNNIHTVHTIVSYRGKPLVNKKSISALTDDTTHVYRLVWKGPDNTYKVTVDGELIEHGSLYKDYDFIPPKRIKDPNARQPANWDDRKEVDDPNDRQPDDWEPELIPDPAARPPEDWDDDMDGKWSAPLIKNPQYKGEWRPRRIRNPQFSGEWTPPMIKNPDYFWDSAVHVLAGDVCAVGIDVWQVLAGTIFDNILVTDSEQEADKILDDIIPLLGLEKQARDGDKSGVPKGKKNLAGKSSLDPSAWEMDLEPHHWDHDEL